MTFIDTYFEVIEKLEEKLRSMENNDGSKTFDQVITGRKVAPTRYPAVLIYPDAIPMRAATTAYTERSMTFTIVVVGKKADIREGFEEVLRLVWRIGEMLEDDRSFEGLVDRLEIDYLTPEVERPRVIDRHEASLTVTFYKIC
ncbi:MAG: hypothetical protein DRN81_02680 [Thermoproteota archaeon]|nr:MAG: hypothetical protein DRN81_02680 [Candidatus Korarchaeota archaeon]